MNIGSALLAMAHKLAHPNPQDQVTDPTELDAATDAMHSEDRRALDTYVLGQAQGSVMGNRQGVDAC